MVLSAGTTVPAWAGVRSLYALTNSMMLRPCGPRAVPTGGAGVAAPAGRAILINVLIFLAIFIRFALLVKSPIQPVFPDRRYSQVLLLCPVLRQLTQSIPKI